MARLCSVLLLLMLPPAVQGQFTYTTNNGTITITGYYGPTGALVIPSTINGLKVTTIGDFSFALWAGCSSVTSVIISDSVTNIASSAFYYAGDMTSVTMSTNVTSIGNWAFAYCSNLCSLTIPPSVAWIGSLVFNGSLNLSNINVDPQNLVYSSIDGVLFNKSQDLLIRCPEGKAGSYVIPNTTTQIFSDAITQCRKLTSVTIPQSVTSIGCFGYCVNLTNVTMIGGVTTIADSAFANCTSLPSLSVGTNLTSIGGYAFSFCTSLKSISLPSGVTNIGDRAFIWSGLTNITIPATVAAIGPSVFYSCANLTAVYFQGNAPRADSSVFNGDTKETVYYLPGTTGWGSTFGGAPAVLWNPKPEGISVQANQLGFTITGTPDIQMVVEAAAVLPSPSWTALQTCTLTNGSIYFSDAAWTNYPSRFYRIRSP